MKNWNGYRLALKMLPRRGEVTASDQPAEKTRAVRDILRRHRCVGATLCLFDETGVTGTLCFGLARRPDHAAAADTVYRAASVSKFVTALGAMKLWEQGRLDLDRDVGELLPPALMARWAPKTAVTLRMLLTHTAGVRDSASYLQGIAQGKPLSEILSDPHVMEGRPGCWEYSNLGAGIAGAVMEAALGTDFETLMQETVFRPLRIDATYYPQKTAGRLLADAYRVLPPGRHPPYDGAARQRRPLPPAVIDAESHYALAHGNLCVTAPDLALLGRAGMTPGFLSPKTLEEMRRDVTPFGARATNLSQGIGTFILREAGISRRTLYGHQGMAYGAVHGLFFDPERNRGIALLTAGASEARRGVLADLNFDLLRLFLGDDHG